MFICKNCGQPYSSYARFCGKCGGEVVETTQNGQQPTSDLYGQQPETDSYTQSSTPAYASAPSYDPAYPSSPEPSGNGKPLGIIGMALGIGGLIFSFIALGLSISAIDAATSYNYYYYYDASGDVAGAFFFAMFTLAASIVGICLSGAARNKGFLNGMTITGKILSIVATALSGLSLFLAFIACANLL